MLMNISEIKERVGRVLRDGFDHKFLNEDNKAFTAVPPDHGKHCSPAFHGCRASFQRRERETRCVSLVRVRGTQRDVFWDRRFGVELLVRVFRGTPNDVAAAHVLKKIKNCLALLPRHSAMDTIIARG